MKVSLFHIIGLFGVLLVFLGNKAQPTTIQQQEKSCCTEQSHSLTESQESCSTISPITTDGEHTHCTNNCMEICHCPISQISLFPNVLKPLAAHLGSQEVYFAYFENHPTSAGSTIWNPPKKA